MGLFLALSDKLRDKRPLLSPLSCTRVFSAFELTTILMAYIATLAQQVSLRSYNF
ncbi:hypothetical protein LB507_002869, partial [Fusarium sp. FIESC RH6]